MTVKLRQKRISRAVALAMLSCALSMVAAPSSAGAAGAAGFRNGISQAPAAGPPRPLRIPAVHRVKFENGLTILTAEDQRAPVITIDIALPVGSVNDPAGGEGLAAATADLLTEGAAGQSSENLAREVERLGAQVSSSAQQDYTEFSVSVLSENGPRLIDVAAEMLLKPDFPLNEVRLYRANRAQTVAYQRQDPNFLARESFNRIVYGSHPYAVSAPTPESIVSLSRAEIERFYRTNYGPEGAVIAVVGDIEPATIEAKLKAAFGAWQRLSQTNQNWPKPPVGKSRNIYLIDRPGSEQADIRIGNIAAKRRAQDFLPLLVANSVLGGGASSRLFLNVREQKGYTYDVASSLEALLQHGTFFTTIETRNEVVAPAIQEILAEFERMRTSPISDADLENAKNYINGSFALSLSTQGGLAERLVYAHIYGLGDDFLQTFRDRVNSITVDQVLKASQAYILPDQAVIVVVGDAATLKKSLDAVGPTQIVEGSDGSSKRRPSR